MFFLSLKLQAISSIVWNRSLHSSGEPKVLIAHNKQKIRLIAKYAEYLLCIKIYTIFSLCELFLQ